MLCRRYLGKDNKVYQWLRLDIQDEINILSPRTIEEAYQCTLKEEEKIARIQGVHPKLLGYVS